MYFHYWRPGPHLNSACNFRQTGFTRSWELEVFLSDIELHFFKEALPLMLFFNQKKLKTI